MSTTEQATPVSTEHVPAIRQHGVLRRHWLLVALLVVGVLLRIAVWLAYQPALIYIDSFRYLANLDLRPDRLNPIGYSVVLRPLLVVGGLAFVAAVQHLCGVLIAVALYWLALRHGMRYWLAALVAAPVLLDGYQLQIEQNIMSEVWFQALLVGMLWLLLARGEPGWRRAGVAGVLLGAAVLVRVIGGTLVVPLALYLVFVGGAWRSRIGWKRIGVRCAAAAIGFAVIVVSYAGYFLSVTGHWGLSTHSGNVLYGRTAAIADCDKLELDPATAQFCPAEPVEQRPGVDYYAHPELFSPEWPGPIPPGETKAGLAHEFGMAVLATQPWDVAGSILRDFAKNFAPRKTTAAKDVPADRWYFHRSYPIYGESGSTQELTLKYDGMLPTVKPALASMMRSYQLTVGYTPGPVLGVAALIGLAATFGIRRARRTGLRAAALLTTGCGLIIMFGSSMFEFSWRYQIPTLVLLPIAGALGVTAFIGPSRRLGLPPSRPQLASFPDEVDDAAVAEFHERYQRPRMPGIVVVIAAYNEGSGLGPVLRRMPTSCCERPVHVLVVVDGATDSTAAVAAEHGVYTCVAPANRGQGAALRLGYHLAADAGADYVVSTDADGQYDNTEMPVLLRPLLDGSADFVTGSRRLGTAETDDRVRWLGVRVFAVLASVLTLRRITDTSFGFRAMRADLACAVTLREPQYQSSELLLGMTARGARVREVPMSMRIRNAGSSKKGRSVTYGANYARVMVGTWWREYVLRRGRTRTDRAG